MEKNSDSYGLFRTPKIYTTKILYELENILMSDRIDSAITIVQAPTGYGKTFGITRILAKVTRALGYSVPASVLMPYRAGIKPMYSYQLLANKNMEPIHIGYGMKGDKIFSRGDEVCLMTVGYWLEQFMDSLKDIGKIRAQIILLDEAHDPTWQTDLALRAILHAMKNGVYIKLVISSATINAVEMVKSIAGYFATGTSAGRHVNVLAVDNEDANIEVHYCEDNFNCLEKGKMSDVAFRKILETLKQLWESVDGNIIIMLPGQAEIDNLREVLEGDPIYTSAFIVPLHSKLSSEEVDEAIYPQKNIRSIILATNMIENSITIENVNGVIDSGLRKILFIDNDGVKELRTALASKSNIKQAIGRCGRQNKRGVAHIMMTKAHYEDLAFGLTNEVHRNPLYPQIIKLLNSNIEPYMLFGDIPPEKITDNINFLAKHEALHLVTSTDFQYSPDSDSDFSSSSDDTDSWDDSASDSVQFQLFSPPMPSVTAIGMMMLKFPCSIRAGQFMSHVLLEMEEKYYYTGAVIAAWMDESNDIFYRPAKRPRQSEEDFCEIRDTIRSAQAEFYSNDCLETMLKAWYVQLTECKSKKEISTWCREYHLFDKMITSIHSNVQSIIKAAKELGYEINKPNRAQCVELLDTLTSLKASYVPHIEKCYEEWKFEKLGPKISKSINVKDTRNKYVVDRALRSFNFDIPAVSLNLRQLNPSLISLSKIIKLT